MPAAIRVTGCKVFLNQVPDEQLKAFAAIILNDEFAVRDLKIIQGKTGLFVAMPSRRRRDGIFHDVAHPIRSDLRNHIEGIVLGQYRELLATMQADAQADAQSDAKSDADSSSPEIARAG